MTQLQVRLYRDSFSRPWGFRLQGGRDIGYPLAIQRVFSNSPAEGELQRGDRVLSIGGQPGGQLTHQQAQDIVKRAGGQIDVFVERPPPSRVSSIATFTPAAQRPRRAQSLQPLTMPGQTGLRLNANPCFNPNFIQQYSPSSPHPPPPWTQQQFAPKKVSKLSEIGGGAPDFGVDYGTHYGTVPRRRHSQPPRPYQPSTMPVSRGSTGFSPKKVTLSKLGGGGPEFGSDFTRYRPSSSFMQPVHVHTGGGSRGGQQGPPQQQQQQYTSSAEVVMMGLDNLSLSPRTPDYGYQAPPFSSSAGGGQYIPTGVRLDMEREQELRQQQQQQQQQQPSPQQHQDYQPVSPQPAQQMYYFEPQQAYVPTGVRLDHQMGEEEGQGELPPVSERRKAFMNAPARHVPAATGKSTAPKVLRPRPGSSGYSFGVDYSKPQPKTSTVTWRPQAPAQRPVNVPPPEMVQSTPASWSQQDEVDQNVPPAWRHTLKTTGVKPWDKDLDYTAAQQQARASTQVQNPDKGGDRDWTQSAVYRMIYEEEHRGGGRPAPQQQQHHQQQQKAPPPPPPPKPQTQTFQQAFTPMDGDYGTSDF